MQEVGGDSEELVSTADTLEYKSLAPWAGRFDLSRAFDKVQIQCSNGQL